MTLSLGPGLLRGLSPLCWQCPGLRYHNGQNLPLGLGKWMTGPCPGILPGEAAESCPFCARHVSSSELSYQVGSGKIPKVQMGKLRLERGRELSKVSRLGSGRARIYTWALGSTEHKLSQGRAAPGVSWRPVSQGPVRAGGQTLGSLLRPPASLPVSLLCPQPLPGQCPEVGVVGPEGGGVRLPLLWPWELWASHPP